MVTIGLAGDTMLGRLVNEMIGRNNYRYPWGDTLALLKNTDVTLINLETTLTTSRRAVPKVFNFKAQPDRVQCLTEAGIDACTLANNHILDFNIAGMLETLDTLQSAGIPYAGAGRTISEARRPLILTHDNLTIGIIGCTDNEPGWEAGVDRPGTHFVSVEAPDETTEKLASQIKRLKTKVDILILSIHWGPNMKRKPSNAFIRFAHRMIEAGADILHGHSAHIFQGIEVYRNKLILYDTGDFVDDYYVTPALRNDQSFFYIVHADSNGIIKLELIPVLISNMQVNRATGRDYEQTVRRLKDLSEPFGTQFLEEADRLVISTFR